ncbi:uncharacterized membrane protein YdcZ (DUF606 family) [Paenibacillus sp. V4I7]|nr:uncharacterized membrane protein YdcZ (DUF606 family) [Paenibacillus sp. V4I7]
MKERENLRGIVFAFLGGACITLQGVANFRISQDIGTRQAATIIQFKLENISFKYKYLRKWSL